MVQCSCCPCFYRKTSCFIQRAYFTVLITLPYKASAKLKIPSAEEFCLDLPILKKETGKLLVKVQGCGIVLWQNTVLQVLMHKCSNLTHVLVKMNRNLPRLLITFDYGRCRVEPCWQSRNREQVSYSAGSCSVRIDSLVFNRVISGKRSISTISDFMGEP